VYSQDGRATTAWGGFDYYADLYNGLGTTERIRIRGRLVHDRLTEPHIDTSPMKQISQDEAKRQRFTLWHQRTKLGQYHTNSEGYFDILIDISHLSLQPGDYTVELRVDNVVAGCNTVTLLSPDHTGLVIRSDIDLTYLDTDFQSATALADLMFQTSKDRVALTGMAAVYKQLHLPTVFLSGSPKFFKRIIEGKMALDGVSNAGIVLKPYKELLVRGLYRPTSLAPALKEQVGYKLARLLQLRAELPPCTRELLLGDDSEADHVIYYLYDQILLQEIPINELVKKLKRDGVSRHWRRQISRAAKLAIRLVASRKDQTVSPVAGIFIRKTRVPNHALPVSDWTRDSLTVTHADTEELAKALHSRGFLDDSGLSALISHCTAAKGT